MAYNANDQSTTSMLKYIKWNSRHIEWTFFKFCWSSNIYEAHRKGKLCFFSSYRKWNLLPKFKLHNLFVRLKYWNLWWTQPKSRHALPNEMQHDKRIFCVIYKMEYSSCELQQKWISHKTHYVIAYSIFTKLLQFTKCDFQLKHNHKMHRHKRYSIEYVK